MTVKKSLGLFLILLATASSYAASMTIDSLSGPVTQNEINSFITYMQAQSPPQTPWGPLGGTGHNEWADGTSGRDLEAMGEMYEVSSNITILNKMISWSDACVSQRNDLMSTNNGGQRVMWTGLIDKVWCPNWPTDMTDNQYLYCGCESEDTIGHMAFCAKLILQTPSIWNTTVPDGNPFGYGTNYFQRATNYLAKCDEANDEYFLKWFIQPGTSLIVAPTNAAWIAINENVNANNRQMMFLSGFQRLAEAHEILGDNPSRVAQYDAIVQTNVTVCLNGMKNFDPYTKNGQPVYDWGYYPTSNAPEATEIHAEYDMIGVYRAFNRSKYGLTLSPLIPFANTMVNVIYLGTNTFAGDVDAGSDFQSPIYSGWILPADWNPAEYTVVAGAQFTNGWYHSSEDIDAGILFMKNRRYLEFSATPTPLSQIVQAGNGTAFTVAVAPLGGFTNVVNMTVSGLPSGATGSFNSSAINAATLNFASTNVTLSISTSPSTPTGSYALNIIGTSGSVSRTNIINLVVGSYSVSASPPSQTVSAGNTANYVVNVATNNGFSGTILFGMNGLPANASAGFNPASLNGAGNSTLSVTTVSNTPAGTYTLTIFGTNGAAAANTTVSLVIVAATPVWTGGSASDNNWSDATNWGGIALAPIDALIFSGNTRLNNINDTAAATTYSNIIFSAGAGAFVLNGNPITLGGSITNSSSNPQTFNLGLKFSGNFIFNGASNALIIGGGLTNTFSASGSTTLTLAGTGILTNLLNSTPNSGGTNVITENDGAANWTLADNSTSSPMTVPWIFSINNGTFNFGNAGSAPVLTSTTVNGVPQDNEVGIVSGAVGTFNMVNGTLTTSARFDTAISANSTGIVNQVGGTLNIGSQFQGANGQNPGEVSIINISGGTMNIGTAANPTSTLYLASRGAGALNLNDGALNCGTLDISRNASGNTFGSTGVVNLNGGTILANKIGTATANAQAGLNGASAIFNFNGGTLKINSSTTPFFQGSTVAPIIPISAVVKSGGAIIDSNSKTNIFAEPLLHDSTLDSVPDGGLTKNGSGCLILISNVTYNGGTTVNAGTLALSNSVVLNSSEVITVASGATLDASGRTDGTLTLANGQTLGGSGTLNGNVIVLNGATLAPGNSTGLLVFNNSLTLNGGSTTFMELNKALLTNDVAQVAGTLRYAGTLSLTNLGGTLASGDSFKLFNAAIYSGAFTNITPVIPAVNLAWNTNGLTNGVLRIVSAPTPSPQIGRMTMGGTNLIFNGTGGVADWTYYVLATTNLGLPVSQWTTIATNAFDTVGNFNCTIPSSLGTAQQFFLLQLQ